MSTRNKLSENVLRLHRKRRVLVKGTAEKPRISVFRSLTSVYAQLVDDVAGKTIVSAHSKEVKGKGFTVETAKQVGELLAKKAKEKKIVKAVFDRAGYAYHGKVAAIAEGARKGGLEF